MASTLAKKFISQKLQKGKEKSKSILAQAEQILLLIHAGVASIFFFTASVIIGHIQDVASI